VIDDCGRRARCKEGVLMGIDQRAVDREFVHCKPNGPIAKSSPPMRNEPPPLHPGLSTTTLNDATGRSADSRPSADCHQPDGRVHPAAGGGVRNGSPRQRSSCSIRPVFAAAIDGVLPVARGVAAIVIGGAPDRLGGRRGALARVHPAGILWTFAPYAVRTTAVRLPKRKDCHAGHTAPVVCRESRP
jgi:hypothetical protein